MPDNERVAKSPVTIITGAGRGIGRGYALGLAERGHRVVIADLDGESAEAVAGELRAGGYEAVGIEIDVSDPRRVDEMVAFAVDTFGAVHVLVNNAGIFGADVASFDPRMWDPVDGSLDQWHRVMAVNVEGVLHCSRAVVPLMRNQQWGRIINQSSAGVYVDISSLYTISKLAVNGITRVFSRALAKDGITVNAIAPGLTVSEAHLNRYATQEEADATMQAFADREIPIGRAAVPADLVGTLAFLASDDSAFLTGQTISVDGGWRNRF